MGDKRIIEYIDRLTTEWQSNKELCRALGIADAEGFCNTVVSLYKNVKRENRAVRPEVGMPDYWVRL